VLHCCPEQALHQAAQWLEMEAADTADGHGVLHSHNTSSSVAAAAGGGRVQHRLLQQHARPGAAGQAVHLVAGQVVRRAGGQAAHRKADQAAHREAVREVLLAAHLGAVQVVRQRVGLMVVGRAARREAAQAAHREAAQAAHREAAQEAHQQRVMPPFPYP
jgi:hypothetical protein